MANPYLDQLELAISDLQDVLEDGKLTVGEVFQLANRVIPRVQEIMANVAQFTEEDRDQILAAADALYDKYITPLDIPWVPDQVENSMVDPVLKSALRLSLNRAMNRFIKNGLVGSAL